MKPNWLILFFLLLPLVSRSQFTQEEREWFSAREDTLAVLAYAVINDSIPERRFAACQSLIKKLVTSLKAENAFHYRFERLRTVSIQYPPDSSFRVFSWQLYVDENEYRYYGAIQMNTPELELYPLIDRSFQVENPEQEVLSNDQWYGAVYYNLKPFEHKGGMYYLLFGFDGFEFFRKRKVVDILWFQDGKPMFGAPLFVNRVDPSQPASKKRILLEYSAEASIRLNFDPALDLLIFDHLEIMEGRHNEGPVGVPDGTYEGYQLTREGFWEYIPKVFNEVQDRPPMPYPTLEGKKKDLFGKEKGKN